MSASKVLAIVALCILPAGLAAAQVPGPHPGPEHARLAYFLGKWRVEGEIKPSPLGPGGVMTHVESCGWFHGGFNLICETEGTAPWGPTRSLHITGFDPVSRVYTFFEVSSLPMPRTTIPKGTVDGPLWTYLDETTIAGRKVAMRFTITEVSPVIYTFRAQMRGPDDTWITTYEATARKDS